MIIKRIKKLLGIEEKPEIQDEVKINEVSHEALLVGFQDSVTEELLSRVWNTGHTFIGERLDDGSVEITDLETNEKEIIKNETREES